MEKIEFVKLLLLKQNLEIISKFIDNIILLLDFSRLIDADKDIQDIKLGLSGMNFMLDELMLKIKKDI